FFFKNLKFINITIHPTLIYEDLDLEIDWLLTTDFSKGLPFWEPAATWMIEKDNVTIPLLQVKKRYKKMRPELLKHETVHIARSAFKEPIYEEFLAYATSKSKWRRFFGPIFRSTKESLFFVVLALLPSLTLWLLIPLGSYSLWLLVRLMIHQKIFKTSLDNLSKIFRIASPLKIAIRLTDKEIKLFARKANIQSYIDNQNCLRWRQIKASYLQNS
ncbi:MAG: hypothetical protein WCG10_08055, partial [Chlamydiota bacterium]